MAQPTNLVGFVDEGNNVNISWRDNADDETKFIVQRSLNGVGNFTNLVTLPANSTQYLDIAAPAGNFCSYRVTAYRDGDSSQYSDTFRIAVGNAPVLMGSNLTVTTCDKVFMDPGGADPTMYQNNGNNTYVTTFRPAIAGNRIRITFDTININYTSSLFAYAGTSVNAPPIFNYYGSNHVPVIDGIGADGAVTLRYMLSNYNDEGWVAHVSCYKPVATPRPLTAVIDANNKARLTWTDNANDETAYIVERSVNAPGNFVFLAQLPANSSNYTDLTTPPGSITSYRVVAWRDTIPSFYSDTAVVRFGNYPFIMKDTTITTCDRLFMDPGGAGLSLPTNSPITCTIKPAITGNKVRVTFSQVKINGYLQVYDGLFASGTPIAYISGYAGLPLVLEATNSSGALSFMYSSSGADSGWVARVSCIKPLAKPSRIRAIANAGGGVALNWLDNSTDETGFVIQRSTNSTSRFTTIARVNENITSCLDTAAQINNVLYYRVFANRDSIVSPYSDTARITYGIAPFLMKDTTLITCNRVFMGPLGEGPGYTDASFYTTTFIPGIPGNSIRLTFEKFDVNSGLSIVNGSSYSQQQIGFYSNQHRPGIVEATGPDGALTIRYYSSYYDTGWVARVSCFLPVKAPTNLTVTLPGVQSPQLTWTDHATDETGYIIERSTGDSLQFEFVAQVNANSTSYNDVAAPHNSKLYYRVRAFRDTDNSLFSNIASVTTGYPVILMGNGSFSFCDMLFYDNGGGGNYSNNSSYFITLAPATPGGKLKVSFNKFRTEFYWDRLNVYSGAGDYRVFLGSYTGTDMPPDWESSAPGGELSFEFASDESLTDMGWEANVYCITDYKNSLWTGAVSTAWEDPLNWSTGLVPDGQTSATIPANVPHFPVVHSNAMCNKLDVKPGATVNVDEGFRLTIVK